MTGYHEFLDRLEKVRTGSPAGRVRELLGEPSSRSDRGWTYILSGLDGFPGMPPPAGTTVFTGVTVTFEDGLVAAVSRSWIDVSGPPPRPGAP